GSPEARITHLSLASNEVASLGGIDMSETTYLNLSNNNIFSISELADCTKLEWLELDNNELSDSDLSALTGHTALGYVSLEGNEGIHCESDEVMALNAQLK